MQIVTARGEVIGTRTVVATIANGPSDLVRSMDLPSAHGRIRTDRKMRVEGKRNVWALGDAALIPLQAEPSERHHWAPPAAQFAVREARRLAQNIEAVVEGREPEDFVYASKGAMASLGAHRGVAEVFGIRLSGRKAWLLWWLYYFSFVPGFATKVRIAANWALDAILGRSIVQTAAHKGSATQYVRYRKGDRVFETGNRADGSESALNFDPTDKWR
jgi:NADH dehydrogenase